MIALGGQRESDRIGVLGDQVDRPIVGVQHRDLAAVAVHGRDPHALRLDVACPALRLRQHLRLAAPGHVPDPHGIVAGRAHAGVCDADDGAVGVERKAHDRPGLARAPANCAAGCRDDVHLRVGLEVGLRPAVGKERDRASVRSNPEAGCRPRSGRQALRPATGGWHEVDVHRVLEQPLGVHPPVGAAQDAGSRLSLVALAGAGGRRVVMGKHGQPPPVGHPGHLGDPVLELGQALRLATVQRKDVELGRALVTVGQEGQRAPVRREAWPGVAGGLVGQAARPATGEGHDPDAGHVLAVEYLAARVGDVGAVGTDGDGADQQFAVEIGRAEAGE